MRLLLAAVLVAAAVVMTMVASSGSPGAPGSAGEEVVLWRQRVNGPSGADLSELRLKPDGSIIAVLYTDYPVTPRAGAFTPEEQAERARLEAAAPQEDWSGARADSESYTRVAVPRPDGTAVLLEYASDYGSAAPPAAVGALAGFYRQVWKRLMAQPG